MRTKSTKQQYFDFTPKSRLKVVNEYRAIYELISQLLDDNPGLVSLVHQDLARDKFKVRGTVLSRYFHTSFLFDLKTHL